MASNGAANARVSLGPAHVLCPYPGWKTAGSGDTPPPPPKLPQEAAIKARSASRQLQALKSEDRVALLDAIADTLVAHTDDILAANAQDVESATGKITDSLLQRLILKPAKISQLAGAIFLGVTEGLAFIV